MATAGLAGEGEDRDGPQWPTNRSGPPVTRVEFLRLATRLGKVAALAALAAGYRPAALATAFVPADPGPLSEASSRLLSHRGFLASIESRWRTEVPGTRPLQSFKQPLRETARHRVLDYGTWIVPSEKYPGLFLCRDSFWIVAALNELHLSRVTVERFREEQMLHGDGHAPTAFYMNGTSPPWRDRHDKALCCTYSTTTCSIDSEAK